MTTGSDTQLLTRLLPLVALNMLAVFLMQLVIFARLGVGTITDVFLAAGAVPQFALGILAAIAASVLVPFFAGESRDQQAADAWRLIVVFGAVFLLAAGVLVLAADLWVNWLFPGFAPEMAELCVSLAKIQLFAMVFSAANSVVTALFQANGRFVTIELLTLGVLGSVVAGLYFTLPVYGIHAAAWIVALASLAQSVLLLPMLGRPRFAPGASNRLKPVWYRLRHVLTANLYYKSDILVDRYLLSMAPPGGMTLFSLAQQIYGGASSVFGKVWGNTAIPHLAECAKKGDYAAFRRMYRRGCLRLLLSSTLVYLAVLQVGAPLLKIALGFANLSEVRVEELVLLLAYLGGTLVFASLGVIVTGAYYALGDTRTPTYFSMASFSLFVVFKIYAFQQFGVVGIALAASGLFAFDALCLAAWLPRVVRARARAIDKISASS